MLSTFGHHVETQHCKHVRNQFSEPTWNASQDILQSPVGDWPNHLQVIGPITTQSPVRSPAVIGAQKGMLESIPTPSNIVCPVSVMNQL